MLRRLPGSSLEIPATVHIELAEDRVSRGAATLDAQTDGKKVMFLVPKATELGGLEGRLLMLLRGFGEALQRPVIVFFDGEAAISRQLGNNLGIEAAISCEQEPKSIRDWYRLFRRFEPEIVFFDYGLSTGFPGKGLVASWFAGVRRRILIQHTMPPPLPRTGERRSIKGALRRVIGHAARRRFKVRLMGQLSHKTICLSKAARDSLVAHIQIPA